MTEKTLESEIRDLAYSKWETAGCPDTSDEERNRFWYEAEQEILAIKKISLKDCKMKKK